MEMQRWTARGIQNRTQKLHHNASTTTAASDTNLDWQPPYDTFTVLVAWIILLVSSTYIAMMDLFILRSNRRNHHHHHSPSTYDGMFTRPDLEDAWIVLQEWYQEQPESWQSCSRNLQPVTPHGPTILLLLLPLPDHQYPQKLLLVLQYPLLARDNTIAVGKSDSLEKNVVLATKDLVRGKGILFNQSWIETIAKAPRR